MCPFRLRFSGILRAVTETKERLSLNEAVSYNVSAGSLRRGGREAEGGGLLIHPDLFARTYFRLFCLRYELLICTKTPHLQSKVQQVFSKLILQNRHTIAI